MQSQERDRVAAFLEGAVSAGASSEQVAALVASTFQSVAQALAPIVGQRGMSALYRRSLHLSRSAHPWLPAGSQDSESDMDVAALTLALAARSSAEAAAAGIQLLEGFRALLTTLIGESLTERLLRPVWATLLSGASARDTNS